jgi:Fibronectin type III domain
VAATDSTGSTSVTVTWKPTLDPGGAPLVGYIVTADSYLTGGPAGHIVRLVDAKTRSVTLTGLDPSGRYAISVGVLTRAGMTPPD